MDTATLPHVEPAPPGPDLPSQLAALQRKAERHKAALAGLATTLARTRRHLREQTETRGLAQYGLEQALELLRRDAVTEAIFRLEQILLAVRWGNEEARARGLAEARRRDHALLTLREKVKALYAALSLARRALDSSPYQFAPLMQEITRALGEG